MSIAACAALVERGDRDRFLAAMSVPVPARAVLFPLYAFNLEVARAPWVTQEPLIAEMRLQWWLDAVAEAAAGKPPRAHEVAAPLAAVIRAHDLPVALFEQMIAARRWDIFRDPFDDAAHLARYLDHTAGHLMWLSARALGAAPALQPAVRDVAWAGGLAAWLQAVPALVARGRIPLLDGSDDAVAALARDGLARLAAARSTRFGAAAFALRPAWMAGPILRLAATEPSRVGEGRLAVSEFRKRIALAWLAARRR